MELSESLIASFQGKANIPPVPLAGMIKAAQGDALEFAQFVIQDSYLDRDTAGDLLANQLNRTYVNLSNTLFQDEMVALLDGAIARRYFAIPLYRLGKAVTVGMVNPNDTEAIAALQNFLMGPISPVFCFRDEIESAIKVNYQSVQNVGDLASSFDLKIFQSGQLSVEGLSKLLDSKPLVELADSIINAGIEGAGIRYTYRAEEERSCGAFSN
ncbi:MAG: hypothetical protein R8K20_01460 [Gallionellaceae bacterium]